ncbi:hypothetical protein SDC9_95314 [bioreactor metagenome]|uniref:DNA topoisomerase (ATP-hydrolyzing) n=1 Tax=bioreactor metagenome TaxID=1076179 RepID=A0A645A601_9ZZZZ
MHLLKTELEIRMSELENAWHYTSLEKIFFEEKIYRVLEQDAKNWEAQLVKVEEELQKFRNVLRKDITREDVLKLVEKPVRKISVFDVKELDQAIKKIEEEMKEVAHNLATLVDFTIAYYANLKKKYGSKFPRKTEISNFETIQATKVVVANAKLYANKLEGFVGMDLKRDENAEFICECSDIDDVIVFLKTGKYLVTKISEKAFIGRDIIHVGVFNKNDDRCIYNAVYKNGKSGEVYVKRFAVTGVTRDKEYDLTQGKESSQVLWFTANPNGEAEVLKVYLKPRPKLKKLIFEFDFANLAIKGRASMGNILSKNPVHKIQLKSKGVSSFGGQSIWFDQDINRLNTDSRGLFLGEYLPTDKILVICKTGDYYTTNFDLSNRYQGEIKIIEKLDTQKVYTATYFDAEMNAFYVKRFSFEPSDNSVQLFISEAPGSYLVEICEDKYPQLEINFGGKHSKRPQEYIDVEEFIGKKSFRAKGKRITTYEVDTILFTTPLDKDGSSEEVEVTGEEQIFSGFELVDDETQNTENSSNEVNNNSPTLF